MKHNERLVKTIGINPQPSDNSNPVVPKSGPGVLMSQQRTAAELEKANAEIKQLKNKLIPIEKLKIVPGRARKKKPGEFEELKANLETNTLVHPIIVRKIENEEYEVVAGHNRIAAYVELGKTHIEADIKEITDDAVYEAAFYSNLFSTDLSDFEKFEGFKNIQEKTKETQKSLAERAGVTPAQISYLFSFDKLPQEAVELIRNQPFCLGATQAAKIAKGDHEKIIKGVKMLLDGDIQTEAQLVSYVMQKIKIKDIEEPTVFKSGLRKFAEVSSRHGVIAIKLKDSEKLGEIRSVIELAISNYLEKNN